MVDPHTAYLHHDGSVEQYLYMIACGMYPHWSSCLVLSASVVAYDPACVRLASHLCVGMVLVGVDAMVGIEGGRVVASHGGRVADDVCEGQEEGAYEFGGQRSHGGSAYDAVVRFHCATLYCTDYMHIPFFPGVS